MTPLSSRENLFPEAQPWVRHSRMQMSKRDEPYEGKWLSTDDTVEQVYYIQVDAGYDLLVWTTRAGTMQFIAGTGPGALVDLVSDMDFPRFRAFFIDTNDEHVWEIYDGKLVRYQAATLSMPLKFLKEKKTERIANVERFADKLAESKARA